MNKELPRVSVNATNECAFRSRISVDSVADPQRSRQEPPTEISNPQLHLFYSSSLPSRPQNSFLPIYFQLFDKNVELILSFDALET
jgi:hypothetical protein